MAEIPLPNNAGERYAALEQAYVEEHWADVVANGQALLEEIEESDDPQAESLANRVRVLIGHTHLYGLQRSDAAQDYYRAVLTGRAEPELRRIATEGLRQCQRPPAPESRPKETEAATGPNKRTSAGNATGAGRHDPFQAAVRAAPVADPETSAADGPAMPWLKDLAAGGNAADRPLQPAPLATREGGSLAPRLEVEVVEEPELVEVAQADPELSQELELELSRIRERRAARAAAVDAAAPGLGQAAERPASTPSSEPLDAASGSASPWNTPSGQVDEARAGWLQPPQPQASGSQAATRQSSAVEPGQQVARAEVAVDLSGEDPDLVAGLLVVTLLD